MSPPRPGPLSNTAGDEELLQLQGGAELVTFSRHAAGPHQVRLVPHEDGGQRGHPRLQPRHRRPRLRQARPLREAEHGDHAVHRAGGVRLVLRMRSCGEAASLCCFLTSVASSSTCSLVSSPSSMTATVCGPASATHAHHTAQPSQPSPAQPSQAAAAARPEAAAIILSLPRCLPRVPCQPGLGCPPSPAQPGLYFVAHITAPARAARTTTDKLQ